ncbi:transmembrane protein, putative [Medicago truncatula]|uniref:Transmembrane protein, putative n=1 Tax=Medicago truncatula TaxID=3880 RepID=A0A072UYG8_MEDTR|nr:transmembrane protein, putative [Medicago truncatula]
MTLNFGIIRLTQIPTQIFGIITLNGFVLFCFPNCGEKQKLKWKRERKATTIVKVIVVVIIDHLHHLTTN